MLLQVVFSEEECLGMGFIDVEGASALGRTGVVTSVIAQDDDDGRRREPRVRDYSIALYEGSSDPAI